VSTWTRNTNSIVFFGERGYITCSRFWFIFLKVEFAEVGVKGKMFDFTVFEVFLVIWLSLLENVRLRDVLLMACSNRTFLLDRVCTF
jgi:hypothetical protein